MLSFVHWSYNRKKAVFSVPSSEKLDVEISFQVPKKNTAPAEQQEEQKPEEPEKKKKVKLKKATIKTKKFSFQINSVQMASVLLAHKYNLTAAATWFGEDDSGVGMRFAIFPGGKQTQNMSVISIEEIISKKNSQRYRFGLAGIDVDEFIQLLYQQTPQFDTLGNIVIGWSDQKIFFQSVNGYPITLPEWYRAELTMRIRNAIKGYTVKFQHKPVGFFADKSEPNKMRLQVGSIKVPLTQRDLMRLFVYLNMRNGHHFLQGETTNNA